MEEDGGEDVRTIGDLLNELAEIHSTSPSRGADGGGVAPAPASKEAIEALKDVPAGEVDGQDCAIFLDHGAGAAAAAGCKEMPCGHRFHGGCLEKWLRAHCTCPVCRHEMPTAPPPAEEEEAAGGAPLELRVVLVHSGGMAASTRRRLLSTAWTTRQSINNTVDSW